MKTILCPTDFSKNSENALLYAVQLAKNYKSKIILMHAYETPVIYTDVTVSTVQIDFDELKDVALSKLKKLYSKLYANSKGVRFEFLLQQGLPSSRINEIAIEKKVDMIVMATSSGSEVDHFLVGSNSSRVLRDSQCLLLLVPPKAKFNGLKKIVFTTDLSKENLVASQNVIDMAKMFKSELIFLNVDNKSLIHDDKDLDSVNHQIRQYVSYPKMKGFICTDMNVADGITTFLKDHKADCLAMVTHHRKYIKALFNPSITKKVAYKTDIPLLIVHIND